MSNQAIPDYQTMYFTLFRAVTQVIRQLDDLQATLIEAQRQTEALYILADEPATDKPTAPTV